MDKMHKNNYRLTIIFDIEALDDIEARQSAKEILGISGIDAKTIINRDVIHRVKLQKVFPDMPPVRIEI